MTWDMRDYPQPPQTPARQRDQLLDEPDAPQGDWGIPSFGVLADMDMVEPEPLLPTVPRHIQAAMWDMGLIDPQTWRQKVRLWTRGVVPTE